MHRHQDRDPRKVALGAMQDVAPVDGAQRGRRDADDNKVRSMGRNERNLKHPHGRARLGSKMAFVAALNASDD